MVEEIQCYLEMVIKNIFISLLSSAGDLLLSLSLYCHVGLFWNLYKFLSIKKH